MLEVMAGEVQYVEECYGCERDHDSAIENKREYTFEEPLLSNIGVDTDDGPDESEEVGFKATMANMLADGGIEETDGGGGTGVGLFQRLRQPKKLTKGRQDSESVDYAKPVTPPSPLLRKVDLSKYVDHVYDQSMLKSCTANAVCGALGLQLKKQGQHRYFNPSRMFLWYNARNLRKEKRGKDIGVSLADTFTALCKQGVCSEEVWPYYKRYDEKPTRASYRAATMIIAEEQRINVKRDGINILLNALSRGDPFVFNFDVYDSFRNPQCWMGSIMPKPEGELKGNHAVVAVGYNHDEKLVKILDSHRADCWRGKNGFFFMPYDIIENEDICANFWISPVLKHEVTRINYP